MAVPIRQLLSQTSYAADGVTTVWDFSFASGYIDQSHVKAYYTNPNGTRVNISVLPGMFSGPFQLTITPAIPAGTTLTIYRDTPKDAVLVDFVDRAAFTEVSLDTANKQAIFGCAEATDGLGVAIESVDTVVAFSVAAKASADAAAASAAGAAGSDAEAVASKVAAAASEANALASKNAAATSAGAAATSATNAATSEANALASKNAAATSATAAATSEANALASKNAAATSETNALASKNAAATSATNAAASEANALASKNAAATSAANSATSATNSANSASAAAASAASIAGGPVTSVNTKTGIVTLTKADLGLDQVDNTSDYNKPPSFAVATILNDKYDKAGGIIAGRALTDPKTVAFSATPDFPANQSNVFYFGTLTGNVTSMTISLPGDGQSIGIRFQQDGTGGRTIVGPANVTGVPSLSANAVSWLTLTYVGFAARWEGSWSQVP